MSIDMMGWAWELRLRPGLKIPLMILGEDVEPGGRPISTMSLAELASLALLSKSEITDIVAKLETLGYLRKVPEGWLLTEPRS